MLANAVVKKAADDYRAALKKNNQRKMQEIESFFTGDDFRLFTRLDGPNLMRRLQNEAEARKKSGVKGVHWNNETKKWRVELSHNKIRYQLGTFVKLEDAIKARKDAEKKIKDEA